MSDEDEMETQVSRVQSKAPQRSVGWVVPLFAVISLVALGLAGWAVFRPAPSDTPTYTDAQRADAKTKTCAAFNVVRLGVNINTNLAAPGGPEDVTGALAVQANGRIALYNGGPYLLARLDPATPTELADTSRKFANELLDIGAGSTAGLPNSDPGQAVLLQAASASADSLAKLCK